MWHFSVDNNSDEGHSVVHLTFECHSDHLTSDCHSLNVIQTAFMQCVILVSTSSEWHSVERHSEHLSAECHSKYYL